VSDSGHSTLNRAGRRVSTARLLRNGTLVYIGNFIGAIGTVGLLFVGKQYTFGKGAVGEQALQIATSKTGLGFVQAIAPTARSWRRSR
jgi:formate/nitrite transporter FocA (FNT family)